MSKWSVCNLPEHQLLQNLKLLVFLLLVVHAVIERKQMAKTLINLLANCFDNSFQQAIQLLRAKDCSLNWYTGPLLAWLSEPRNSVHYNGDCTFRTLWVEVEEKCHTKISWNQRKKARIQILLLSRNECDISDHVETFLDWIKKIFW